MKAGAHNELALTIKTRDAPAITTPLVVNG